MIKYNMSVAIVAMQLSNKTYNAILLKNNNKKQQCAMRILSGHFSKLK